jgi:pyrimidine operon attenuation protein/uracil phosphoribosyltransferase
VRLKANIMDAVQIDRALSRIAHEIVEKNSPERIALVGIRTRGVPLAETLHAKILEFEGIDIPLGNVDVTLYRDDLSQVAASPIVQPTELGFDLDGHHVVLVDDVLFTGRTVRAAMDVLMDYGRASSIQLAVLVDRGHRELPIRADYVGKNVPTSIREVIKVACAPIDGEDCVTIFEAEEAVR